MPKDIHHSNLIEYVTPCGSYSHQVHIKSAPAYWFEPFPKTQQNIFEEDDGVEGEDDEEDNYQEAEEFESAHHSITVKHFQLFRNQRVRLFTTATVQYRIRSQNY